MPYDIAFSKDTKENPLVVKNVEYVKSIIYMIFKMRPGEDTYNPNKGLDIGSLIYKNESQLSQYEIDIKEQFQQYTDILVSAVRFVSTNDQLSVVLTITYEGEIYNLILGNTGNDIKQIILEGGIK